MPIKTRKQLKIRGLIFSISLTSTLLLLSACSSNTLKIATKFKESPKVSRTGMSNAISCMGNTLKKGISDTAYIFMVRDIIDGTIKNSIYQDGPLSDSGRIQMTNVLSDHLNPQVGLVMDTFPAIFSRTGNEKMGLNRLGLPSAKNQQAFIMNYANIIQHNRRAKQLAPAKHIVPLIISGSFTRYDSDNIKQDGSGHNLGSRTRRLAENETDSLWRRSSGQVDLGNTLSAKALSLVVNLVDPRNNLVVASQSLSLIFYRKNKTFRLRIGVGDGYYGISNNKVEVEGVHGAQKVLIDAAALWIMNKSYGSKYKFSPCFNMAQKKVTMTAADTTRLKQQKKAKQAISRRKSTPQTTQ
jgi:hypothetical protein